MKIFYTLPFLCVLFITSIGRAQINMTEIGFLDIPAMHSTELNDIWGYTDEEGNEYALVGCFDGVSVVDISDPTTPEEVEWIPGLNSIWRDIKTVGDYAYVTTEASGQGLLIIDLSPLPADDPLPIDYYFGPDSDPWDNAHNVYADDEGYVYISGANRGNGGIIILDVQVDPMNPEEVGVFDDWYSHDAYVQDDVGYFSHVSDGFFSIVDLTDKTAPVLINTFGTIDGVSHNAWASMDGDYLFTTDETADGYVASYDISDPLSISLLDQVQSSPGSNIIPHNAHVLGNYLITSYYTDGVVVHDISDPSTMTEVASFDTSPSYSGGTFNGCWGVYPYFASELIIASDTEEGLYVLQTDFLLAGYLEGTVTDEDTGLPINGVEVEVVSTAGLGSSDPLGYYSVGVFEEGTFTVNYTRSGYYPESATVVLTNGIITVQDMEMDKIPLYDVVVHVTDMTSGDPVENAQVKIQHTLEYESGITDAEGNATIPLVYDDNYWVHAGKWGYITACESDVYLDDAVDTIFMEIETGIYDDFTFDFGWAIGGDATNGMWEREVPVGVASGPIENPFEDVDDDCSDMAYLTGNGSSSSMVQEVDSGEVVLTSPSFDLTDWANPGIFFSSFFQNAYGTGTPDDYMRVYLSNGTDQVMVLERTSADTDLGEWVDEQIQVTDFLTPTASMQFEVVVRDDEANPHLTEGAIDHFYVGELSLASLDEEDGRIAVVPNPFSDQLRILGMNEGRVEITDLRGRKMVSTDYQPELDLSMLESGVYLIHLYDLSGNWIQTLKQIKR